MKTLAVVLLLGVVAALAPSARAQTAGAQTAGGDPATGAPANICGELVAFLQPKPAPANPPPAAAPQGPTTAAPAAPTPGAGKPPAITLEEATGLATANDLRACQQAAQKLRRAGLALPAGLIALAALKPELLGPAPR